MNHRQLILVVEDEKAISGLLSTTLQANGYKAIVAEGGRQAVSMASSHCPDLVLLDLGLPDMDGMEVLKAVRGWSRIPVIVVSARESEQEKVAALDGGADDYVTKPFNTGELLARIRTALRRGTMAGSGAPPQKVFEVGGLRIDYDRRLVTVDGEAVHLTPMEYRMVTLLSSNAGRVLTHETILRELWGPYGRDHQLLRVNMANIRRKLEKNPADPRYILTEIGVGYRMVEEDGAPPEAEPEEEPAP